MNKYSNLLKSMTILYCLIIAMAAVLKYAEIYDKAHDATVATLATMSLIIFWSIVGFCLYSGSRLFFPIPVSDKATATPNSQTRNVYVHVYQKSAERQSQTQTAYTSTEEPKAQSDTHSKSKAKSAEQLQAEKEEAERILKEEKQSKLDEILLWTKATFEPLLTSSDMNVLLDNIKLFADCKDIKADDPHINARINGVTNTDLNHFGWTIGKRLNKTNIEIADFLKSTFPKMLENVEVMTISAKLRNCDGKYSLKLQDLRKPLMTHVFPVTLEPNFVPHIYKEAC